MTTVVIMGAGGKMGLRTATNLARGGFDLRLVEVSEAGRQRIADAGLRCVPEAEALAGAEAVVLAVPDALIGRISHAIAPGLRAGTMLVLLDPAAPFAGELPKRDDLVYFVAHPCHPPIFNDETDPAAQADHFGGVKAKQHIVCALMQGPDSAYTMGEAIARAMYAPVMRAHRVTVEQMAIMEPALSETVGATCVAVIREAMDEAIRRGVPAQAAQDFIEGHLRIEIAILFGHLPGAQFSDGAKNAIARAKTTLFQKDWKKLFEPDALAESIHAITRPKA